MCSKNFIFLFYICICFISLVSSQQCGVPSIIESSGILPKIINGTAAVPHSWPWIISMRLGTILDNFHTCGGSLIDSTTVITAAHCVENIKSPSEFFITAGINYLDEKLVFGVNAFNVKEFKIHWNYNPKEILNDIAIIKLSSRVRFSEKIQPICLPPSFKLNVIYNKDVYVAGWGAISGVIGQQNSPNELLEAKLRVITNNTLCFGYQRTNYCTIDPTDRKSNTCLGDSGGPLMYLINGKWHLYGLVSFGRSDGINECINTIPSFHTRVPSYLNWITKNRV